MWMVDVRKSKKQGRLDPRRVRQLDKLGFVWQPRKRYRQDFYAALLDYRKRYGDCRVPSKWPENHSLANWVERTRAAKKRNLLTKAQIQELDQIGFTWSIDPRPTWERRFTELEAFKKNATLQCAVQLSAESGTVPLGVTHTAAEEAWQACEGKDSPPHRSRL